MSNLPPPPPPPPPGRGSAGSGPSRPQRNSSNNNDGNGNRPPTPPGETPRKTGGVPRWALYVLGVVLVLALFLPSLWPSNSGNKIDYTTFMNDVIAGKVDTAEVNNSTSAITGEYKDGTKFTTTGGGDRGLSAADEAGCASTTSTSASRRRATTGSSASPGCSCRCC